DAAGSEQQLDAFHKTAAVTRELAWSAVQLPKPAGVTARRFLHRLQQFGLQRSGCASKFRGWRLLESPPPSPVRQRFLLPVRGVGQKKGERDGDVTDLRCPHFVDSLRHLRFGRQACSAGSADAQGNTTVRMRAFDEVPSRSTIFQRRVFDRDLLSRRERGLRPAEPGENAY